MHVVISLNKPKGLTSNDALIKVKKTLKIRKAGHAGTLDPLATGVLLIGTNEATKILPYLCQLDKEYVFTAQLGIITDTYDSEGKIVEKRDFNTVDKSLILKVSEQFKGTILQKPPIFSALKHKGKPLYKYARNGIVVDTKPREVCIHTLELLKLDPPDISFRVVCSTGTYIRSLCHDLGLALGTGAHIVELTRTRTGNFTIQNSLTLEEVTHAERGIFNIDKALSHIQEVEVDTSLEERVRRGERLRIDMFETSQNPIRQGYVRISDKNGKTFGIGWLNNDMVTVRRILHV